MSFTSFVILYDKWNLFVLHSALHIFLSRLTLPLWEKSTSPIWYGHHHVSQWNRCVQSDLLACVSFPTHKTNGLLLDVNHKFNFSVIWPEHLLPHVSWVMTPKAQLLDFYLHNVYAFVFAFSSHLCVPFCWLKTQNHNKICYICGCKMVNGLSVQAVWKPLQETNVGVCEVCTFILDFNNVPQQTRKRHYIGIIKAKLEMLHMAPALLNISNSQN